jgi:hypothetical protein
MIIDLAEREVIALVISSAFTPIGQNLRIAK